MSEMRLARATAAAIMTGILPLPPERRVYPEFCVNVLRECKQQKLV